MAILNYTTSISTEKTASEIQKKLAMAGAQAVLCEYDEDGVMKSMSFRIGTQHGLVSFRLPANIAGVYHSLERDDKVPKRYKTSDQAAKVAWRILKDWIEAQLAIIEAGMAEMTEVFLPYAQDREGRTMYEVFKEGKLKMITEGRS